MIALRSFYCLTHRQNLIRLCSSGNGVIIFINQNTILAGKINEGVAGEKKPYSCDGIIDQSYIGNIHLRTIRNRVPIFLYPLSFTFTFLPPVNLSVILFTGEGVYIPACNEQGECLPLGPGGVHPLDTHTHTHTHTHTWTHIPPLGRHLPRQTYPTSADPLGRHPQADIPLRRPLKRTIRILLEYIIVDGSNRSLVSKTWTFIFCFLRSRDQAVLWIKH